MWEISHNWMQKCGKYHILVRKFLFLGRLGGKFFIIQIHIQRAKGTAAQGGRTEGGTFLEPRSGRERKRPYGRQGCGVGDGL